MNLWKALDVGARHQRGNVYRGWGGKRAKVGYEEDTQDISEIDLGSESC